MNDRNDESPFPGLRSLRDIVPPPSLVPGVMAQIAEPRPFSLWGWLMRPRQIQLRLSPLGLVGVAGALALVAGALTTMPRDRATTPLAVAPDGPATRAAGDVVMVRFVMVAKGAKEVRLAGDFNEWRPEGTTLENADGQGTFVATIPLPRGAHEYMFWVDGRWVTDPNAAEVRPDGFGRSNGVLRL
jgi:hypothetical protein